MTKLASSIIVNSTGIFENINIKDCGLKNEQGGALHITNSSLTITNCMLENNSANMTLGGGAIYASQSMLNITDSIFLKNVAGLGGAIMLTDLSSLYVKNTI